jgi:hypothetical protein
VTRPQAEGGNFARRERPHSFDPIWLGSSLLFACCFHGLRNLSNRHIMFVLGPIRWLRCPPQRRYPPTQQGVPIDI